MKFICFVILLAGLSANADSLVPGLWKATTSYRVNGVPLPHTEDQECISKAQAKDIKATLTSALQKKGCDVTSWQLANQQLVAQLACDKDGLKATGTVQGAVTPMRYDLVTNAKGTYKGIPSVAVIRLIGERVDGCAP